MSDAVQRYLEKMQATHLANMEFFKQKLPDIYGILADPKNGQVAVDLHVDENMLLTLKIAGQNLTQQKLRQLISDGMIIFAGDQRSRIVGSRSEEEETSKTKAEKEVMKNYLQNYYYTHLHDEMRIAISELSRRYFAAIKQGAENGENENNGGGDNDQNGKTLPEFPDFGPTLVPLLIVYGSAYGVHLAQLLERYSVRQMIVIDSDAAITRLSTWLTDYVALYNDYLAGQPTHLSLIVADSQESLLRQLRRVIDINASIPPYFLNGASCFYGLHDPEHSARINRTLAKELWAFYKGWGFFDDEYISLRHTIANLHAGRRLFRYDPETFALTVKSCAIVVASGPSLDGMADLLRRYRDSAIIVSCGSAVSALEKLDIVPDFHVEIERPWLTAQTLAYTISPEFKARLRIIGPTVLHPETLAGAREAMLFLKEADCAGDIFPDDHIRVQTYPTVSNGAVGWLLRQGVRRIALVGVDLGAKSAERHHAQHSFYYSGIGDAPKVYAERIAFAERASADLKQETAGNFGGTVRTTMTLSEARQRLETEIAHFPDTKIWNLNDGAKIAGTIPMSPEQFSFDETGPKKRRVVEALCASAKKTPLSDTMFKQTLSEGVQTLHAALSPLLSAPLKNKTDCVDRLIAIYRIINLAGREHRGLAPLLRGSLLHFGRRVYDNIAFLPDNPSAAAFATEAFQIVATFLDRVRDEIDGIDPDAPPPEAVAQRRVREEMGEPQLRGENSGAKTVYPKRPI